MFRQKVVSNRPCMETLEARTLLAATTAAIVGADLVVTGTSGPDSIAITRNAGTGAYTIAGVAGTFTAMGNLRINAGAGNDTVILTNISIGDVTNGKQGNLIFEGGAGADSLTCHHVEASSAVITDSADGLAAIFDIGAASARCELTGGITFTGSAANDSLRLLAARIRKNVVCTMGDGTNFIQTATDAGTSAVLEGSLSYTGGIGNDSVQILTSSWVYAGLTANLGDGTNAVTFQDAMLANGVTNKVAPVTVTGGAGNDTITADHLIGGGLTAKLGEGVNWTIVEKGAGATVSNLDGVLSVTGGVGDDHVRIVGSTVTGACTVALGGGTNSLETAADGASHPDMWGKITYTGGLGADTLSLLGGPSLRGGIKAVVGDGINALTLRDAALDDPTTAKYAALQYTGGAGIDTITADHLECAAVTVNLGGGTNAARLQKGSGSAGCLIHGNVAITAADGNDTVEFTGAKIQGNSTLSLGEGTNGLNTSFADTTSTEIGGKLGYTGGAGQDSLNLLGSLTVAYGLTAKLGEGTNSVSFRDTYLANGAGAANVAITGGSGPDTISGDSLVAGNFTANLGEGNNACYLYRALGSSRTSLGGKTTITGGAGADTVDIQGANLGGGLAVKAGNGTNNLIVQSYIGAGCSLGGPVSYTGGDGVDTITWSAGGLGTGSAAFPATFTLGAGDDTFSATSNATSAFWGDVSVNAGAGADHITFGTFFGGKAKVDGGVDADLDVFTDGHNYALLSQPTILHIP
ncbi:MAG: hypothetical protein NT031_11885 [Planctomycetota bacterium]|nr:hypothetical protein [Planctomycetota bacterium]